ncbi:MAG: guanylate kinase [bacterium]
MSTPGVMIVSAPSGAGKTSLTQALVSSRQDVGVTVSHTTRALRQGEIDGVHYHFVPTVTFEQMIQDDQFVEYATVFGNYYGTSVKAINDQLLQGRHAILEIDWQGARKVREKFPESLSIFVMPPSLAVLEQRLRDRGQDSEQVIARRMREAQNEISHKDEYDRIVVNIEFDHALAELDEALSSLNKPN